MTGRGTRFHAVSFANAKLGKPPTDAAVTTRAAFDDDSMKFDRLDLNSIGEFGFEGVETGSDTSVILSLQNVSDHP